MMKRMILPTLVLALAAPAAALSQAAQPLTTPAFSGGYAEPQDDPAYERATEALDQAQYDEAIALFGAIAEQRGARADAALYWIAYSQSKSGQEAGALETIARLRALYPQSRWLNDAGYLEAEVRGAAGQAPARGLLRSVRGESVPPRQTAIKKPVDGPASFGYYWCQQATECFDNPLNPSYKGRESCKSFPKRSC